MSLTVCGSEVQARVLVVQLANEGIETTMEPLGRSSPLERSRYVIEVHPSRLEDARQVLDRLRGAHLGSLTDPRRLVPAILLLVALVAVATALVRLFT